MIYRPQETPPPLFSQAKAEAARDAAIEAVGAGVDSEWYRHARSALEYVASTMGEFTVDDVQERLARAGIQPPKEPRAMGAVMTEARRDGLIVPTGQYKPGRQVRSHRNPRQVWRRAT